MSASNQASHLAILFADLSGSTRLYELLGDSVARLQIAECLRRIEEVVVEHGGKVVKTIGDEVMCTFPEVESAVIAACGMQELFNDACVEDTADGSIALSLRIGLHAGPTLVESTDVFGDAVNVAARMVAQAKVGQIITTRVVVDQLPSLLRGNTRLIDHAPVKGKRDTFELFEVMWQQDDVTRMSPDIVVKPARRAQLTLKHGSSTLVVDDHRPQIVLGRSKAADLTVVESLASRLHARIEYRRGKFFLVDQSTNGTYVRNDTDDAFLRREEALLTGSGAISLGRPFVEKPQDLVEFEVQGT
ncbi:MAG TPA: adenylate/guanylate cyclase domain-containing protein [Gammaproteobacteria bacterium]|nr:adenylate/guanylate cyclase domain-containing protein [Gammaproteobacteria bacterium]